MIYWYNYEILIILGLITILTMRRYINNITFINISWIRNRHSSKKIITAKHMFSF
ncbi:hypothetical protein A0Y55_02005 [Campylobacter lari]|uniref:Uncharacterized protein n=1 Tax=Campylobacter lari TaxID=201 RepID=A0A5L4NLS6_CAMLA|nr:hypothetical protein [Campylobacter lari]EAK0828050.1 hypothetical protein [Campylobacter lari]